MEEKIRLVQAVPSMEDELTTLYTDMVEYLEATRNWPRWIPGVYPGRQTVQEKTADATLFAGYEGDRLVAAVVLNRDPQGDFSKGSWKKDLHEGDYLVIHSLSIDCRLNGKGYGRRMVEACLRFAQDQGYKAVRLDVVPDNMPAVRLYEKCGFSFAGEVDLGRNMEDIPTFSLYEYNW